MGKTLQLCIRFLLRDWRSGELWLLILSLLMAICISTAISLFSERLQLALGRQVAEIIGADLVISGSEPLSKNVQSQMEQSGLKQATVIEFPSVVIAGDAMQLVSAKGVTSSYPLRGQLRTADQPFDPDKATREVPASGEVWLEPRLFPLLGITTGDSLQLGAATFTVTRTITLETDKNGSFYSLSPRLLFNLQDLEKTGVIQPGSRVIWKTLLAGEPKEIEAFRQEATPLLKVGERLSSAEDNRENLRGSVVRLRQFLGLASMAAILLAGIAIAMSSRRFAERHFDGIAVMRCMGAQQKQILNLFIGELFLIAVLVAIPGVLLGWLMQMGLIKLLAGVLPAWLPSAGIMPMFVGGATGVITLAGFGLAPLLRLRDVAPLRVLRRDLKPVPASALSVYGLSFTGMTLLLWYHTGELMMTIGLLLGIAMVLVLSSMGIGAVLTFIRRRLENSQVSLTWRLGIKRLFQEKGQTSTQLIAFSLTFLAMALMLLVRTNLLERWQQQLPDDTPNYFALNIQPSEVDSFKAFLENSYIQSSQLYPMIRGRLTQINGIAAVDAVPEEAKGHNSLNRELNLTWSDQLPLGNQLESGKWWSKNSTGGKVSVEISLVEHLGIKLGDQLTFNIAGTPVEATVTSLRRAQWESFQPNFYMILPEQSLKGLPATWLNSFYLSPERKIVLNDLVKVFPTLTLLDLDAVISQVQVMLEQSILAVEAMLVALLLAGLLVMASSIESSLDSRLQEGALIRSLGGTKRQLLFMQVGEFILIGAGSGLIAAIATEFSSFWLNSKVLELPWQPAIWLWFVLPLAGALLVGFCGWLGVRKVIDQSPGSVLKEV